MRPVTLEGPRVRLRPWRDEDLAPLAALNADPEATRYLGKPLDRAESDAWAARMRGHLDRQGWGFWVVDHPGVADFLGVVGLAPVGFRSWFTPAVEIAWRIAPAFQRRGYAEEAARLALDFGFAVLRLPEIVAFTVPANLPSRRLMAKLGMSLVGEFDHPRLPEGHPLRPHLLHRLNRADWNAAKSSPAGLTRG
jgi:RimJ/RimL family protein N-acetyltransferase